MKDSEIIYNLRLGDKSKALKTIYTKYGAKVRKVALSRGASEADFEDVFQEAVMVLYEKAITNSYGDNEMNIGGFLTTVCKNHLYNMFKKQGYEGKYLEKGDFELKHESDFKRLLTTERNEFIEKVFEDLGGNCNEVLKLTIYEGYRLKDVAKQLGFASVDVAKTVHYRCKKKLVEKVKSIPGFRDLLTLND